MSQEKAQLIAPLGVMAVEGMNASGVITATSLDGNIVGSAKSLVNGANVSVGVITATSFAGNLTGNIARLADSAPDVDAGVTTATSFVGNLTGSVTDLNSQPAITVGMVTATTLEGPVTGNITGNVTGIADGLSDGLGINYNGGWTGAGTSQITAGVVTATTFYGGGGNLDGVSSGPVRGQSIGITSATTAIDLINGNLIYATQSANTTVSFANTANGNVYFIRTQDTGYSGTQTITWPTGIGWSGGSAPTLLNNPTTGEAQIFLLVTRDMGLTWYGKETFSINEESYSIWSYGANDYGTLGQNNRTKYSSPIQIGSGTDWKFIGNSEGQTSNVGQHLSSAIKTDGTLWTWGNDAYGALAQNTQGVNLSSPTQVPGTWSKISNSGYGSLTGAVKTDGTLWTWGYNFYGQLGHNIGVPWPGPNADLGTVSSPTQVPGTTWENIHAGNQGFMAKKTDGTMWGWGQNTSGNLGQNNIVKYSSPTQVGSGTDWSDVQAGQFNTVALKTDGSLWTWGIGQDGGGGQNSTTTYSSPLQVGTDTTWNTISAGYYSVLATKTDGTLWSWGSNTYGKLGLPDGNQVSGRRSSPTQVGTGTDWVNGVSMRYGGVAFKNNGTAWSWGRGYGGVLGQNDQTDRSSPTQVPGVWSSVSQAYWGHIISKPA